MYKQILQGFRRKAVPFSLWVGLFLLMISFYEAIWQTPYATPVHFLIPALLFCLVTVVICGYSFVSYEYRLMHDHLFIRLQLMGHPIKAKVIALGNPECTLVEGCSICSTLGRGKQHYYLPLIGRDRCCMLRYQDRGALRYLVFRPCSVLVDMIRLQLESERASRREEEEERNENEK